MKKTTKKKKKNTPDLTLVNLRSLKARLVRLEVRVKALEAERRVEES